MWRVSGARFSLGWILDAVRTTNGSVYRRLVPGARLDTARDSSENRVTDTCMQGYAGGRFGQEVDEQRRGSQESTASRTPAVKVLQVVVSTRRSLSWCLVCTTTELLVVELSLGRQRTRWPQIRVSAVVVTPERSHVAPQRGLVSREHCRLVSRRDWNSGECRCWRLFVYVLR